jgi:hypothetical protein
MGCWMLDLEYRGFFHRPGNHCSVIWRCFVIGENFDQKNLSEGMIASTLIARTRPRRGLGAKPRRSRIYVVLEIYAVLLTLSLEWVKKELGSRFGTRQR